MVRLARGISMGELTERDEDIIRAPDRSRINWQRFYGKFLDAEHW